MSQRGFSQQDYDNLLKEEPNLMKQAKGLWASLYDKKEFSRSKIQLRLRVGFIMADRIHGAILFSNFPTIENRVNHIAKTNLKARYREIDWTGFPIKKEKES